MEIPTIKIFFDPEEVDYKDIRDEVLEDIRDLLDKHNLKGNYILNFYNIKRIAD